jgi:RNA polymerase sigma-70 factor (ECF subfamily)
VTAPSALAAAPPSGGEERTSSPPGDEPPTADRMGEQLAELMTSCAIGDQQAFAELYDRTVQRIYGSVLRVLRVPEHAEEVTQEVYVEVWRQAPRYASEKGSVMAWMATMAHRRAVDRIRSRTSEVARDERYAYANAQREGDDVWDSVAQNHDVERVRRALATLTPIQQQAVQLAYLQGLTQSEIADLLKVPMGTVKTRIRDGFRRLAAALRSEER